MASTYVNDLRLNEMATGDQSGSWGTVTNTNLELIGEALGYGTQQVFGSDQDATTTVADGAADPARAMYFRVTSNGNLTANRTMTIAPNTVSRLMFIENATSGSQSITVKQGSNDAANKVIIPTGDTKAVYLDGAGGSGVVKDAFASLSVVDLKVQDDLTVTGDIDVDGTANLDAVDIDGAVQIDNTVSVGVDDTGYDVKFFGATSGKSLLWDESADSLIVTGTTTLVGTTNLDNVDVDGSFAIQQANSNTPTLLVQAATTASDFSISGYSDSSGAYYMLGANAYLNSGGNNATWDANENTAAITLNSRTANGMEFATGTGVGTTRLTINGAGSVGIGVADGDVTGDGTAARTYVGIIGTGNRGRLNLGTTAVNGADVGALHFTNGSNDLASISVDTNSGVQNAGPMQISSTGNLLLDVVGEIVLDADSGGAVKLKDAGFNYGTFFTSGSDFIITTETSNEDIIFRGVDDGNAITALTLDMSDAGAANFNNAIRFTEGFVGEYGSATILGLTAPLQVTGNTAAETQIHVLRRSVDANSGTIAIAKSRSTSSGSFTALNNDDFLGQYAFVGDNGTNMAYISASITAQASEAYDNNGVGADLIFNTTSNNATSTTERMRIDNDGNCLLGISAPVNSGFQVNQFNGTSHNGIILKTTRSATGTTFIGFVNSSGAFCGNINQDGATTVALTTSSDQRLKENIADSDDSGSTIDAIKVRKFNWIDGGVHEKYGFIAQELKTVVPEAVSSLGLPDEDDPMLGVNQSKLIALAIKEIQLLRVRVAELETKVTALEG